MSRRKQTSKADDPGPPGGATDVLLLACCAPCSGEPLRALGHDGVRHVVYFYNPNIHPRQEYERRRDDVAAYCRKLGIKFVEGPYDPERWFERTAGMDNEPQRGRRCAECFGLRLERAAEFASSEGLEVLACTLGRSGREDDPGHLRQGRQGRGRQGLERQPRRRRAEDSLEAIRRRPDHHHARQGPERTGRGVQDRDRLTRL